MPIEESKPGSQGTEAREALERFVVENDDLLTLESRVGRFNIFDALGITRAEIRHSNFLAFLLDPAESHGQGQLFLKAILMDLLKNAPPDSRPLSPIDLDGTDLRGVEIKREWKNIDLLITCRDPQFAVVVENKVGSQEHSNQLNRYQATMNDHYPGIGRLYVYLTPGADKASEDSWLPYSYADIHRVLNRIRDTYRKAIGEDVLLFLDHYLNLLGTRFMYDEKLDELCRQIYKNHRQALKLIWERASRPESAVLDEVEKILKQDARWHVLRRSTKYVDFMPKAWLEWLPPFGPEDDYPFCVGVWSTEGRLAYSVFVGPMQDAAKRNEIVNKPRAESSAFGFKQSKASGVPDKWARISAEDTILEWGEDNLAESAVIREIVEKSFVEVHAKLE